MFETRESRTEKAFEDFCRMPDVAAAMTILGDKLPFALVKSAFMEGAKYATDRCKAAGHN